MGHGGDGTFHIRPADLDDVDALASVELHTALSAYAHIFPPDAPTPTLDEFTARWRVRLGRVPRSGVFVATASGDEVPGPGPGPGDGEVLGLVMADPDPHLDPDPETHGNLRALYVRPDHWGRGIGRQLHDVALEYLRLARPGALSVASLWVMERNTRARARYESWGWKLTADHQEIWPTIDELRYELVL